LAVLVAVATAGGLFSAVTPRAEAGTPTTVQLALDCDTSDAAVDTSCTFASGTTTVEVDVVIVNNTGSPTDVDAFNFNVRTVRQDLFDPSAPVANTSVQPGVAWNCTLPPPSADANPDPIIAESLLSCSEGTIGNAIPLPAGGSVVLATVTYAASDGSADFELGGVSIGSDDGNEIVGCTGFSGADECLDTNITVGVAGDTPTPTATATPVTPTATPCVTNCPTPTPKTFVTITPTPGGETATPVPGGGEPTAPPPPPPPPGGGGQQPGGGAGAGGQNPIRLPDTGANDGGGMDWMSFSLVALIALAAGGVAGGTYYYAARRVVDDR
jgi:hypothetical protein